MKDLTASNKMRWAAGGLYGLLCLYQMFLVKVIVEGASPSNVYFTWLYAIVLVLGAAAMSVWMFYGKEALSAGARRAIVAGTVFCAAAQKVQFCLRAAQKACFVSARGGMVVWGAFALLASCARGA